jgi:hypothetical protein
MSWNQKDPRRLFAKQPIFCACHSERSKKSPATNVTPTIHNNESIAVKKLWVSEILSADGFAKWGGENFKVPCH